MVYLCGSDLEERYGAASDDFVEAANAEYSEEVTFVVQTGGTKKWESISGSSGTTTISSKNIERYLLSGDSVEKIATLKQQNMGKPETLADFITFCTKNYPADHQVLIIWDHGGGSTGELACDQNFGMKGLSLKDLRKAFSLVFSEHPKTKPFDIIGFDACLMASLDVALQIKDYAHYMVASEESEPGYGWNYTPMLTKLSQNTSMSPTDFGKIICDTYVDALKEARSDDFDPYIDSTLSLINLAEISDLKLGWDLLGFEMISLLEEKDIDEIFSTLGRAAESSDNFTNSKKDGYSNMMDMGSFIHHVKDFLPEVSSALLEQLDKSVLYRVGGDRHKDAHGISCYYPYDGGKTYSKMLEEPFRSSFVLLQGLKFNLLDPDKAESMLDTLMEKVSAQAEEAEQPGTPSTTPSTPATPSAPSTPKPPSVPSTPKPHEDASGAASVVQAIAGVSGKEKPLPSGISQSIAAVARERNFGPHMGAVIDSIAHVKPLEGFSVAQLENIDVVINEKGDAVLNIGKDKCKYLESVYFYLALFDVKQNVILMLGKDADMYSDWENGIFTSHFTNNWAEINGNPVTLDINKIDSDNFYYSIPIKLNGKRCSLQAYYSLSDKEYRVQGVKMSSDSVIDKFLVKIKKGDQITTVFDTSTLDEGVDFQELDIETFTVDGPVKIKDTDMGDATYVYIFEMNDLQGHSATSKPVMVSVKDGKISFEH